MVLAVAQLRQAKRFPASSRTNVCLKAQDPGAKFQPNQTHLGLGVTEKREGERKTERERERRERER